jgi:hypothetical protein
VVGERLRPVFVLLDDEGERDPEPELNEEDLIEQIKESFGAEEITGS